MIARSLRAPLSGVSLAAAAAALLLTPAAATAADEKYGDAVGRVVFEGDPPELAPRVAEGAETTKEGQPVKDAAVCAADAIPDFSLVVGEDGGVANVFLYPLRPLRGTKPALEQAPQQPVVFDQEGCVFKPHCLIVRAGQPISLVSSDPVAHNVRFTPLRNRADAINLTIPANAKQGVQRTFAKGEPVPIPAFCDFHPWMKAQWLVADSPYAVLTDADGKFEIKDLPPGKHNFVAWHESAGGFLDKRVTIEVKAGETTDLGDLTYEKSDFKDLK